MAPTGAEGPVLRTERLLLRPLERGDVPALTRLVNDYSVAGKLARVPFPYPRELADTWIAATWAQIAAGEAWHLAIVGEEDGAEHLVGCVGLTRTRDGRAAELGVGAARVLLQQGDQRSVDGVHGSLLTPFAPNAV